MNGIKLERMIVLGWQVLDHLSNKRVLPAKSVPFLNGTLFFYYRDEIKP